MFILGGRQFDLAKIGLVRAGCPRELAGAPWNRILSTAIVVLKNKDKFGMVEATGYCPSGVIIAGALLRSRMLEAGYTRGWAYVECGAMEIKADDAIGSSELMSKLDTLILEKLYGSAKQPMSGQPWPYIQEVYPFENYCIYTFKGQKYRQGFALDPIERKVALRGGSVAVNEKYVDANSIELKARSMGVTTLVADAVNGRIHADSIGPSMSRVQTGVRYAWAPTKGNVQSFTTGGRNSELVTQIIRNWSNIVEAVSMYLNYVKLVGAPGKQPWQPPTSNTMHKIALTPDHKVPAAVAAAGIDLFSFAKWSSMAFAEAKKGTKKVGTGESVPASKFAYVGDKDDPSTWHLPIHDATHARDALSRINQTKNIPSSAKAGVLSKIRQAAKKHGVDVSKPSAGQKKWVGKKMKSDMGAIMPAQVPATMSRMAR